MIDPKVKDDVIRLLYKGKGTADIAKNLGVEQNYIVAAIREIQNDFPGGFAEDEGYSDNLIGISIHPKYKQQMFVFVEQGGFDAQNRENLEREKQEEYKGKLEVSHLELAVRAAQEAELNADKSQKEAKSSRYAAWVSAIAGVKVIIWEIFKSIK